MRSVNSVTLIGYVGKAPETRLAAQGLPVANFSLATHEKFKNSAGEIVERTEWHNLVAFGKIAEVVGKYVEQGCPLYIRGTLQARACEKDGRVFHNSQIRIIELSLLGKSGKDASKGNGRATPLSEVASGDEMPF